MTADRADDDQAQQPAYSQEGQVLYGKTSQSFCDRCHVFWSRTFISPKSSYFNRCFGLLRLWVLCFSSKNGNSFVCALIFHRTAHWVW